MRSIFVRSTVYFSNYKPRNRRPCCSQLNISRPIFYYNNGNGSQGCSSLVGSCPNHVSYKEAGVAEFKFIVPLNDYS